jgi:hypothetical protein
MAPSVNVPAKPPHPRSLARSFSAQPSGSRIHTRQGRHALPGQQHRDEPRQREPTVGRPLLVKQKEAVISESAEDRPCVLSTSRRTAETGGTPGAPVGRGRPIPPAVGEEPCRQGHKYAGRDGALVQEVRLAVLRRHRGGQRSSRRLQLEHSESDN